MCCISSIIKLKVILTLLILISATTAGTIPDNSEEEPSCHISFNNEQLDSERTSGIVQECLDTYPMRNLTGARSSDEKMQILAENENNCALKCINENLNVTTADGRVDVSKILSHFQDSNATAAYVTKLTSLLSDCEQRTAEKIHSGGGLDDTNLCKYHVMFMHCYRDAYLAARPEISKLC